MRSILGCKSPKRNWNWFRKLHKYFIMLVYFWMTSKMAQSYEEEPQRRTKYLERHSQSTPPITYISLHYKRWYDKIWWNPINRKYNYESRIFQQQVIEYINCFWYTGHWIEESRCHSDLYRANARASQRARDGDTLERRRKMSERRGVSNNGNAENWRTF